YAGGPVPSGSTNDSQSAVTSVPPLPVPKGKVAAPSAKATDEGASPALVVKSAPPAKMPTTSNTSAFDPATSKPISYGTNDTIFKNKDRADTKEGYPTPMNVKKPEGPRTPAGTAFSHSVTTCSFSIVNAPLTPTISKSLGTGANLT